MIPSEYCLLVKCPHCGGQKELLQLLSGNTFEAVLWSDTKQIAPMLPKISPVQKCPHCGKYYLMSRVKETGDGSKCSFEQGWLTFNEAIEANSMLSELNSKETETLAVITVWAYNDIIRRGDTPTEEENSKFVLYVREMLKNSKIFENNLLFRAELCREIGEFEKCISILENFVGENSFVNNVAKAIKHKAIQKDSQVFVLDRG